MGANSLVLILAQPFWGIISDKLRSVKLTLVICMLLQGIMALSLRYCNAFLMISALFFSRVKTNAQAEKAVPFRELHLERVFKDTGFLLFLPVIFLMQLPHRAAYTFYPLLISSLGGDKMMVGYTSAVMFVSEGICMFASRRILNRFKAGTVIMISAVFFLLWQFMYSID